MEVFHQEIQELIIHCQKSEIDFNLVYNNALHILQEDCNKRIHKYLLTQTRKYLTAWKCLLLIASVTSILIFFTQQEFITIHASAIGRIALIKALPFYDWRPLKRETCLIKKNPFALDIFNFGSSETHKVEYQTSDCNYCDGINSVITLNYDENPNISDEIKSYYDIDAPILISKTQLKFEKTFLKNMKKDHDYIQYSPCDVESNVFIQKSASIEDILDKLDKAPFYFAHWRHCNLYSSKLFRRFFPRPDYLHVNFASIQQSWVVLSKNYDSHNKNFKELKVADRLGLISVIEGHLKARLTPIGNCFLKEICNDLVVDLYERDALIFSDQWVVEYLLTSARNNLGEKKNDDINVAVVLETH